MASKLLPGGKRKKDICELKADLIHYRPDKKFPSQHKNEIVIALFGNTGAGKSSLINSLLSIFREDRHDIKRACVGDMASNRGITVFRAPYQLTDGIRLIDNRGFDRLGEKDVIKEITAQLEGKRGYTSEVIAGEGNIDVKGDAVHIAIFVVNGDRTYSYQKEDGTRFIDIFKKIQGRSPLVVITHADSASKKNLRSTRFFLKTIGVDPEEVFEVENQTGGKNLNSNHTLTLLSLLKRCTINAQSVVEFKRMESLEQDERNMGCLIDT